MATYCGKCGTQHSLPMSSMRTSKAPCEFCGGFDKMNVEIRGGSIEERNLSNYSYPTNLLPTPVEAVSENE